jgi:ATP-dependent 26S proteasome regulatory subunit
VIDGVLETPGRIVIMTSNYPERIDKALLRPGRIDVRSQFELASRSVIKDMFACYYDTAFPVELEPQLPDMQLSPAAVSAILLECFGQPDIAVERLISIPSTIA